MLPFTVEFDHANTWAYVQGVLESWRGEFPGSSVVAKGTQLVCAFPAEFVRDFVDWLSGAMFKGTVWVECEALDLYVRLTDRDSPWLVF